MIKNPQESPSCTFQDTNGGEHTIKVITLSHLYGEALASARIIEGLTDPTAQPRSMITYAAFGRKLSEYISPPGDDDPLTVSDEVVFFVAEEMETKLAALKKTCSESVNSAS